MPVPVYGPAVSVTAIKMVGRRAGQAERFAGAERELDLTPFLGEHGAIRTVKDIHHPAGAFTITFPDRIHPGSGDSLAGYLEPMDMVEIRAAHEPHRHAGGRLPLIMRGFISAVRRAESFAPDGAPQRVVVLQGHDMGKLWMTHHIFWEVAYVTDQPFLSIFRMQASTGMQVDFLPVADFMRQLCEQVVNAKVRELAAFASQQVRPFRADCTVPEGAVSPTVAANFQGPIWSLVELFTDRPWNEAFIEDEEEQPIFRFRPAPYRDLQGRFIMQGATDPGTVEIDQEAVVSLDTARTDARVANFFWVPPGASMIDTNAFVGVAALQGGDPLDIRHPNNRPELYGLRKLEVPTRLLPLEAGGVPATRPQEEQPRASEAVGLWHERRRDNLRDMNRDNALLEEGTAVVRGSEDLRIGRYLRLRRGDLTAESYITRVAHTIQPFVAWTTQLGIERGTGFVERQKHPPSPYWAERRRGPYDR